MRIIAGEYRGRVITAPSSKFTRPMTDRVRETLFNILNNLIDFDGITVLDIYSGSGALGLESLSRGAASVHFVEKNFPVRQVLEQNIASLKAEDKCRIFSMEALRFSDLNKSEKYDLILADPPFFHDDIYSVVRNLLSNKVINENNFMIIERSIQTKDKDEENFGLPAFKKIGDALLYRIDASATI
ncbi:MAG TPA: 16S rRNA (guanine(966)-N(2))-methyltransferase RsmD [Ignavibacteriales bacterium]|nr:16S rRNA (guanine(966)-N(2))-methyltransferase RsmD [Ignavibacteriales bacterium]